jgi:hypothetical protein
MRTLWSGQRLANLRLIREIRNQRAKKPHPDRDRLADLSVIRYRLRESGKNNSKNHKQPPFHAIHHA